MSISEELKQKIIEQIEEQIIKESFQSDEEIELKNLITAGIKGRYLSNNDSKQTAVENFFREKNIVLEDLEINNKEDLILFERLYNLVFKNCTFVNFTFLEENRYLFKNCTFSDLDIKNCKTFENEILFTNCIFNNVTILSKTINVSLFDECKIKKLEAKNVIFKKSPFYDSFKIGTKFLADYDYINFYDCIFKEEFFIGRKSKIINLTFLSCKFDEEFNLSIIHPIKNLNISYSSFNKKVDLNSNIFTETLKIQNSKFRENVIFDKSEINIFELKENIFEKMLSLSCRKISFFSSIDNSFEILNFRKSKIEELNLSNSIYIGKSDFLEIETKVSNRETARIIKDSFEQKNNIIEANKFYAIEMKKREDELSWKDNFLDKLVFKAHGLSSNYSQNWLLALFWIIQLTLVFSVNLNLDTNLNSIFILILSFIYLSIVGCVITKAPDPIENQWKFLFSISIVSYFVYGYFNDDYKLNKFSSVFNPFSIADKSEILFGELIYKLVIAYLIYQLIISIRQNTRRK